MMPNPQRRTVKCKQTCAIGTIDSSERKGAGAGQAGEIMRAGAVCQSRQTRRYFPTLPGEAPRQKSFGLCRPVWRLWRVWPTRPYASVVRLWTLRVAGARTHDTCPQCGLNAWAPPDVVLIWSACEVVLAADEAYNAQGCCCPCNR